MSRPACEHGTPLIYDRPACPSPHALNLIPALDGRVGYAFTPDGLHLSLWALGQDSRETTVEAHHACELARAILREFGARDAD